MAERAARPFRLWTAPVIGWALYDFANTMFSFVVLSRYFNEWLIIERHKPDWYVGAMSFVVGLVLVLAMPAAGAVSDLVGRRLPFLAAFTALCVAGTAALGFVRDTTAALVIAGVAIFGYQLALAMYDPLLAVVAPPERRGRVSGFGVGMGYLGAIVAAVALNAMVAKHHDQQAFVPTAVLFALFALPVFLFVREPVRAARREPVRLARATRESMAQVRSTLRHVVRERRDVARFLVARFLYVDAIATVIGIMTVYLGRVGGFSDTAKTVVLLLSMVAAALGAFVAGRLVERLGPKRVLRAVLLVAAATLLLAATAQRPLMWVAGPLVGIVLGTVWTSDRVFMMRLSPPELRGEYFGLYNLIGKVSSGFGPLVLWGGTTWLLHFRSNLLGVLDASRWGLVVLCVAVLAGWTALRPLDDRERYDEPLAP